MNLRLLPPYESDQNSFKTPSTMTSSISVRLDDALADAAAAAAAEANLFSIGKEGGTGGAGSQFMDRVRNFDVFSSRKGGLVCTYINHDTDE